MRHVLSRPQPKSGLSHAPAALQSCSFGKRQPLLVPSPRHKLSPSHSESEPHAVRQIWNKHARPDLQAFSPEQGSPSAAVPAPASSWPLTLTLFCLLHESAVSATSSAAPTNARLTCNPP